MNTSKKKPVTPNQHKQILRFMEEAFGALHIDSDGAERIIKNGEEFEARLEELIIDHFIGEEVEPGYMYPFEYQGPKPIGNQIMTIAKIFDLDPQPALEFAKTLPELPTGAEGWFAIPKVDAIAAKHFPEVNASADRYCRAVELVFERIRKSRSFYNNREGEIAPNRLRQHIRTLNALNKLADIQKGDILIVAAQFGMRHRGRSVRRARHCFLHNEFGLGVFAVGCMSLVHPERYVSCEKLNVDCPGDEFALSNGDDFLGSTVFFLFFSGRLEFNANCCNSCHKQYGSVSGFL